MLRHEGGQAMMLVIFAIALLSVVAVTLVDTVTSETTRSARSLSNDISYQAAEAGLDDYTAKLLDDHLYYLHTVAAGEATRRTTGGTDVGAGSTWSSTPTWTYPYGFNNWRNLANGYQYSLEIFPPDASAGKQYIRILSVGRKQGTTSPTRTIETLLRPSSVADFQMLADASISYGSAASTYGKVYSTGNVTHDGTAYANVYAEGRVYGPPTLRNGARTFDSASNPSIRTMIKSPVNFSDFLTSFVDIQRAAGYGGITLDNSGVDAWKLTFNSTGTVGVQSCTKVSGNNVAQTAPSCGATTNYNVPSNGAIYVNQTAIVSGTVKGRVTVASNNDVVIAGNISYATSGVDVLGLVAKNDMVVAYYAPSTLTWSAATITQSGQWTDWCGISGSGCGSHSTMTFTGSTATKQGGSMSMFNSRTYNYDTTLLYLQPPWFPTVEDAYTVLVSRQLPGT